MVILVPDTTRLLMSTGSFASPVMRNGLKTETATIPARASSTAAGNASLYPQSQDFAAWTRAMSVTETGRREAPRRFKWPRSRMREDLLGLPAAEIELRPGRQEVETGLRQRRAALAREHGVEPFAQGMQMQHVGSGISELRLAEAR